MKTNSTENVQDIDVYNFKIGSPDSSKLFKVYIDYEDENITGASYENGFYQQMLDTKECVELLESLIEFNRPTQRDITSILRKIKNDKTI